MAELSSREVQDAVATLESHFTRDEVELLRRDRNFVEGLILARFHRMAAVQRRRFIEAKADEIRAKIDMLRAANELNDLDVILESDTNRLHSENERAKQQRAVAQAEREAAEREINTRERQDRIHNLRLEIEERQLEEQLARLQGTEQKSSEPTVRKSKAERLHEEILKQEQELERKLDEMRSTGLSEDHRYFKQVQREAEAKINALRRQL